MVKDEIRKEKMKVMFLFTRLLKMTNIMTSPKIQQWTLQKKNLKSVILFSPAKEK